MSDNRSKSVKTLGKLQSLFVWPVLLGIILAVVDAAMFLLNVQSATIVAIFLLIYVIVIAMMWFYYKPSIVRHMLAFARDYAQAQHQLINELAVPYALMDEKGRVLWINDEFRTLTGVDKTPHCNITSVFTQLDKSIFMVEERRFTRDIAYKEHEYNVEFKKITMKSSIGDEEIVDGKDTTFIAMYMFDRTEINQYKKQIHDEQFVVGLIYIDNIEEALEGVEDARRSLFVGLVDKKVNKYFAPGAAIVRKIENDKYFVVFTYQFLEKMIADKFSILEEVKSINPGNEKKITVSIAIGTDPEGYARSNELAKGSMDLALGRGGDQAVVKIGDDVIYFGGKSQQTEKNDRVKVRMKALALKQILATNDEFFIMGHQRADIDSFGSCLGLYIMAMKQKKKAHIVINEITTTVEPFISRFINNSDYDEDMFYTGQQALEHADASTVLIVVDVNKPEMTDCPELLNICKRKIVFDHHRKSNNAIEDTVLSYVDSSASSSSEIVTEMFNYILDGAKIKGMEADAMYAGIVIDTDGFNIKSGPRTFEAAASLRRNGADVNRVRKMLRNDMSEYKAIAHAVSMAEVYRDSYAITVFDGSGIKSPTVGGAQAANELLDIKGIKASFVVTQVEDKIFVSARSIDEVNVQLIMERLGGGGHMTVAGAQFTDETIDNTIFRIKTTLDDMISNDEL